jgi:hypothetical protein
MFKLSLEASRLHRQNRHGMLHAGGTDLPDLVFPDHARV